MLAIIPPLVRNNLPSRKWGSLIYRDQKKDEIMVDHVQNDVLYWSEQTNFAEIKGFSIFPGNMVCIFQLIASEQQELNVEHINTILKTINKIRDDITRVQIWYLVPPTVFPVFCTSMKTADEKLLSKMIGEKEVPLDVVVGTLPDLSEKSPWKLH